MTENRFSCVWGCVETLVPSLFPSKALILPSQPALQNHQPSSGKRREVARQSLWWQILQCSSWLIGKQLRGQCRQGRAACSPPLLWSQAHGLALWATHRPVSTLNWFGGKQEDMGHFRIKVVISPLKHCLNPGPKLCRTRNENLAVCRNGWVHVNHTCERSRLRIPTYELN